MSEAVMQVRERSGSPLRRILALDGITCLLMGLVLVLAPDYLSKLFALPHSLLLYAGILLFPCAALILAIAGRTQPPASLVWTVIAGNALWVLGSLVALVLLEPNLLGQSFVLLQAAAVVVFIVYERRELKMR